MRTTTNTQSIYSTMPTQDNQLFDDEQIQRFDADTIKNRYGENWKNFASTVREVTQPDGSIVKEYIIEDPTLLEEIKPLSRPIDSTSSTTGSDDEQQQQQQSLKNKFAQIKAKFEQKNTSNVMGSRSTSSATGSSNSTTATRQSSRKQIDDLYARHRRASNESIPNDNNNNKNYPVSSNQSVGTQNSYYRSQSIGSEKSKGSSFRRFNSADEADEEVSQIHRQGEELRRHNQQTPSMSSSAHEIPQQCDAQYEIVDEDGNPMTINGVQDLIKMSGVRAREVPQPDGTIIKEYVIDDPQLLSQFCSQQQQQQQQEQEQSSMATSYIQQRSIDQDAPPPPPRVPLRPPMLFRQGGSSMNDNLPYNIQQIHVLEPQRRYEYLTTTGRRIQFFIINSDSFNGQYISDSDIRELTNAINLRLLPPSNPIAPPPLPTQQQQQGSFAQTQFNLPKQWYPSVDLTHRQRFGSDSQPYPNNSNTGFQQIPTNLFRSTSSGALNQATYFSQNPQQQQQQQVLNEPINQWNTSRYQDSHNQRHQTNETFQSSAQFLPQQQVTRSMYSPPIQTNHPSAFHQQSTTYPYQGQQQHGVRILNDFNQQRTAIVNDGNTRI